MPRRAPKRERPVLSTSLQLPEVPASWLDTKWMDPLKRICIRKKCGKEFIVVAPHQWACEECQPLHRQERRHAYYVEVESADGRKRVNELHAIARAKRIPQKVEQCRICGKDFVKLRCQVTCGDPECRKQNRISTRAEYDDRERDAVNKERREKRAADTEWRAADNKRRREKRAAKRG
jgi:hypothetical protein